jgi:hypothetical protein
MNQSLFLLCIFLLYCVYIECVVKNIFFRPNIDGILTFRMNNIIPMLLAPFRYISFWSFSMWDINFYTFVLFFYVCIFFIPMFIVQLIFQDVKNEKINKMKK